MQRAVAQLVLQRASLGDVLHHQQVLTLPATAAVTVQDRRVRHAPDQFTVATQVALLFAVPMVPRPLRTCARRSRSAARSSIGNTSVTDMLRSCQERSPADRQTPRSLDQLPVRVGQRHPDNRVLKRQAEALLTEPQRALAFPQAGRGRLQRLLQLADLVTCRWRRQQILPAFKPFRVAPQELQPTQHRAHADGQRAHSDSATNQRTTPRRPRTPDGGIHSPRVLLLNAGVLPIEEVVDRSSQHHVRSFSARMPSMETEALLPIEAMT